MEWKNGSNIYFTLCRPGKQWWSLWRPAADWALELTDQSNVAFMSWWVKYDGPWLTEWFWCMCLQSWPVVTNYRWWRTNCVICHVYLASSISLSEEQHRFLRQNNWFGLDLEPFYAISLAFMTDGCCRWLHDPRICTNDFGTATGTASGNWSRWNSRCSRIAPVKQLFPPSERRG